MDWRDELYSSSFRGVPFHVQVADGQFARRHEVHEFPGRDGAVVEDFGRAPDRFTLDAFVIGADWLAQKRRLIEACTGSAARAGGTLVHPWFGALAVYCTACRVSESNREGNVVRFALEFVRVDGAPKIAEISTPESSVDAAAAAVGAGAADDTAAGLTAAGSPDFVREGTTDSLSAIGELMQRADAFGSIGRAASSLSGQATALINEASVLSTSPVAAAVAVKNAIESVLDASSNALAALSAYETFFELEALQLGGLSVAAVARDTNARLIASQARATAIAGAVRAAARVDWTSIDDAREARARILDALDLELDTAEPALYEVLAGLRTALVNAVPPPDQNLPRVVRLTLKHPESVLELAYRLYDDAARAGEIVDRNRPEFPGSMSALSVVEVLSQ